MRSIVETFHVETIIMYIYNSYEKYRNKKQITYSFFFLYRK